MRIMGNIQDRPGSIADYLKTPRQHRVLNAIAQELADRICPSKINSILQPDEQSLVLILWNRGQEQRLAIAVDPRFQFLYLTRRQPENQAFAFAKFLQHHVKGGEI